MELYRRAIEDAVRNKAQLACLLSEDWMGGFDDTVQKCKDRVLAAQGFFLLLGYYYGWVPKGEKSITHLEFDCAFDRWKSLPYPPMAVFAPRQDSEADQRLKSEAEKFVPVDPQERNLHAARLQAFRSEVLSSGRTAQFYRHEFELRENAIVACLQWKGRTPLAAAGDNPQPSSAIPDNELGSLGRKLQFDAIDSVLALFNAEPDQPCAALLVCGDEDAGHRVFLQCLATSAALANCRPSKPGHPPLEHYDVGVLVQWVASALGIEGGSGVVEPPKLADLVAAELRTQPLYFMLDRVQGLAGGLPAFASEFWCPLRHQLAELHRRTPLPNRLIAVITDYESGAMSAQLQMAEATDANLDFSRLVRLPRLADFNQQDVLLWLNKIGVPDLPAGRRKQIALSVLKNAAGDADAKPLRVYERLRSENLFQD